MRANGNRPGEGAAHSVADELNAAEPTLAPFPTQAIGNFEVVVAPVGRGRFTASCAGRLIVEASRQPMLDAARRLAGEGADPRSRIAMRHAGADHAALTSTVGQAARLTVKERARDGLSVELWEPFHSPPVSPAKPKNAPGVVHPAVGWLVLPARRTAR